MGPESDWEVYYKTKFNLQSTTYLQKGVQQEYRLLNQRFWVPALLLSRASTIHFFLVTLTEYWSQCISHNTAISSNTGGNCIIAVNKIFLAMFLKIVTYTNLFIIYIKECLLNISSVNLRIKWNIYIKIFGWKIGPSTKPKNFILILLMQILHIL